MLNEPCSRCDLPAVRLVGTVAYCDLHASELLDPIRARVAERDAQIGHGRFVRTRADHGPGYADLACPCGASWVGYDGDPCDWCERRRMWTRRRARDDALRPPEFVHRVTLREYATRLRYAVLDDLISADEAQRALAQIGPEWQ